MVLAGVLQMGIAIGMSAADSLFISQVGADRLPVIYAVTPVMMLIYVAGYARLLSRKGIDFVFHVTLGILVVGGVLFGWILQGSEKIPVWALYAAKLYTTLWFIGLYSLMWNYVDGFFNLSDAKKAYGLIAGGAAIGAIAGGMLVTQFSDVFGVGWLFTAWAFSAALAWPVLRWIELKVSRVPSAEETGTDQKRTLQGTFGLLFANRFVWVFTLLIFLTLVTATVCEFRTMSIFEAHVRTAEELAPLFGRLYAAVNVFNLLITLVVFQFLVRHLGVRNIALIQPVTFLLVFGLFLLDEGIIVAYVGFVALQGVMTSVDYNNVNLLFNALPEKGKEETRTVIEGICEPMATATAGVFLLLAQQNLSVGTLSLVGFLLAAGCFGLAMVLRIDFVKGVVENVRRGWLDFSSAVPTRLAEVEASSGPKDQKKLTELIAVFGKRSSTESRLKALEEVKRMDDSRVLLDLLQRMVAVTPHERRAIKMVIVGFGPRAVPAAVKVLREPRFPLVARSVAARVLRMVSLPHLEEMLPSLMDSLVRRMFVLTSYRHALGQETAETRHLDGLRMVYRELPDMTMELALEFMSVTGLLPGYESIVEALRTGTGKERGFALESIEQASGRVLFQRLLPFLDERGDEEVMAVGRRLGFVKECDIASVVEQSIGAAFPLEASAALQAALVINPGNAASYCRNSLAKTTHPTLQSDVRILLKRLETGETEELTTVERILAVSRHSFFKSWGLRSMEFVADDLEMVRIERDQEVMRATQPVTRVGFALAGEFVVDRPDAPFSLRAPVVFGLEALEKQFAPRWSVVCTKPGEMVWLSVSVLRAAVMTRPRVGLDLLRWRMSLS